MKAIKVVQNKNIFVILNVYTPYEFHQNEHESLNRLSFISSYIRESAHIRIFFMGDMTADILDNNSLLPG